jgi:ankyrin repeat protein
MLFCFFSGIDLNAAGISGYTPSHVACEKGFIDIIKLLGEHGANLSAKDDDGYVPA